MNSLKKPASPPALVSSAASSAYLAPAIGRLRTRRSFLLRTSASLMALSALGPLLPVAARGDAPSEHSDPVDLALARLGEVLISEHPEQAHNLAARARKAAGIDPLHIIDWQLAARAKDHLTKPDRVSAELENGDVVFVAGWLLSHSEAGAALLYASANASSTTVQPGK